MDQNDQLLRVAADHARDIDALCADVATVIFPSAMTPPSDATINAVSSKLLQIVTDIEAAVLPNDVVERPITWPILARSGFLREPDLIDFILARVSEDRLEKTARNETGGLATLLLDHADGNIAEAAQTLLAAESLHRHAIGNSHLALSPELLHKLCWRVAAAFEVIHGARHPQVVAAVRTLIGQYSESSRAPAAARKIAHFSNDAEKSVLLNPAIAGVHLHVAMLSAKLDLDHDHVVRLIDAGSSAPYAIMLAAAGATKSSAVEAIYLFRSGSLTAHDAGLLDAGFETLDAQDARVEIANWAAARTSYLAFGQP